MRALALCLVFVLGCEHGQGGQVGGACSELSLLDCRNTEGCQPDICAGCFCDQSFRGCLPSSTIPSPCPQLGCPSAQCCTTETECGGGASCAAPGSAMGCGACDPTPGDCVDDTDCTGTTICEPRRCSCESEKACVPGCVSAADCTEGTACDASTSRCVAMPCRDDDSCPSNFACEGTCTRRACADDTQCDGFCVLGGCFSSLGECRLPVP